MRRVKKPCVSSSAIPSPWSTQPSRVTLMLKVKSPMAASLLQVGQTAGLSLVDKYLAAATLGINGGAHRHPLHAVVRPGRPRRSSNCGERVLGRLLHEDLPSEIRSRRASPSQHPAAWVPPRRTPEDRESKQDTRASLSRSRSGISCRQPRLLKDTVERPRRQIGVGLANGHRATTASCAG